MWIDQALNIAIVLINTSLPNLELQCTLCDRKSWSNTREVWQVWSSHGGRRQRRGRGGGCGRAGGGCLLARVDQAVQDVPLGHLEALCDGRHTGEGCGQAAHILLHVAQQLLKLVQHWMAWNRVWYQTNNTKIILLHFVGKNNYEMHNISTGKFRSSV